MLCNLSCIMSCGWTKEVRAQPTSSMPYMLRSRLALVSSRQLENSSHLCPNITPTTHRTVALTRSARSRETCHQGPCNTCKPTDPLGWDEMLCLLLWPELGVDRLQRKGEEEQEEDGRPGAEHGRAGVQGGRATDGMEI